MSKFVIHFLHAKMTAVTARCVNLDTGAGKAGLRERSIPVHEFSVAE
jgi:hypothetical protein